MQEMAVLLSQTVHLSGNDSRHCRLIPGVSAANRKLSSFDGGNQLAVTYEGDGSVAVVRIDAENVHLRIIPCS